MSFADDLIVAQRIITQVRDQALDVATRHALRIRIDRRPAVVDDWNKVLEIDDDRPEYRIGFSVSLRLDYVGARIWSIVTDLKTGQWQQFLREHVPLDALRMTIQDGLLAFDGWLRANEDLDPLEEARKQAGTAFYWSVVNDGGDFYCAEADLGDYSGWADESGEGILSDADGNDIFTCNADSRDAAIALVEAEYHKLTKKEEPA